MSGIELVGNLELHLDFNKIEAFVLKVKEWIEWDSWLQDKGVILDGNPLEDAICEVVDMLARGEDRAVDFFWNEVVWGDATAEDWFEMLMEH